MCSNGETRCNTSQWLTLTEQTEHYTSVYRNAAQSKTRHLNLTWQRLGPSVKRLRCFILLTTIGSQFSLQWSESKRLTDTDECFVKTLYREKNEGHCSPVNAFASCKLPRSRSSHHVYPKGPEFDPTWLLITDRRNVAQLRLVVAVTQTRLRIHEVCWDEC